MYPNMQSPLSFGRILKGISHSLNIVQKALPIYENAKPMINKTKSIYKNIKNNNLVVNKKKSMNNHKLTNKPSFFI